MQTTLCFALTARLTRFVLGGKRISFNPDEVVLIVVSRHFWEISVITTLLEVTKFFLQSAAALV